MMNKKKSPQVWLYFGVVYLTSILFYIPILLSGLGVYTILNKVLMIGIAFTPSLLGIIFVSLYWDKASRRDFWRRVLSWPKTSPGVLFVSLGLLPLINISAFAIATWLSGEPVKLTYAVKVLTQVPILIQFLLVEFFLGAVSEELGWRGYVLDELQRKYSALTSSLIIGILWAVWHTPAFLIPGLSQYEFGGIFSLNYFCMMLVVPAGSILHTWSYNNSGRSIALSGVLMHFTQNVAIIFLGGIFDQFTLPTLFWPILTCLVICTASIVVWRYGAQTLVKQTTI